MAKYISVLAFLMLVTVQGFACDACGCSISGQGIGLLTNFRTNVVGVRYFNSPFHASPISGNSTNDRFHVMELFVRYQINSKIKLMLTQPFRSNVRKELERENLIVSGLSDTRFVATYALVDKWVGADTRLYWEVGSGFKLPIGKYNEDILDKDLPDNFNPGNGSWGLLIQSGSVYSFKQYGVSLNSSVQLNAKTSAGYHYGHQFSSTLTFFIEKALGKKSRLIPFAGLSGELIGKDQHENGNNAHNTGGYGLLANLGMNFGYEQWQLGASFSKPISQNYSDGEVLADERFSIEMNYFF